MTGKPTILAVDDTDTRANLITLEAVLEDEFDLRLASSGQEAISMLLAQTDVDVILMDLQMPEMDGFEAAARIKKLPGCEDIPIVFITAVFKEDPDVKRGYAAGGVDYLTKPFDPDLLRLKMGIYASFRQRAAVLKARERQIRETEELLRAGRKLSADLESRPVGVLISDIEGRICQANAEVSRICKSDALIMCDACAAMLGWWDNSGQLLKDRDGPLNRALHAKVSGNELFRTRCADGSTIWVFASVSPLFGRDAQVVGAVIVIQDVSGPKQIEAELENRITRLASLVAELDQKGRS